MKFQRIAIIKEQEVGKELLKRALTANGEVSKNPNLNGFIAENWHELTFNFNAKRAGSPYRAKALIPEHGYAKNSIDLGIYQNGIGRAVGRYQAKYGATPEATLQYKNHGDYRGQKLLVPEGQEQYINGSVNQMKATDGTASDPISKAKAVEMQNQMQNGTFKQNMAIQLARGTAVEMAKGAIIGGAITVTVETISLYSEYKNVRISGKDYLKEIGKAAGDGAATGGLTAGIMIPVTAGINVVASTAIASCPLVTIPVTFVISMAVNKLIAPAFGRGEYKKILGEAKYYKELMDMNTDLVQVLSIAQCQFESFFEEYTYQLQKYQWSTDENQALKELHQKANTFIAHKNDENRQQLSCLEDLYATI